MKIFEYRVTWPVINKESGVQDERPGSQGDGNAGDDADPNKDGGKDSKASAPSNMIQLVGGKELILSKQLRGQRENNFTAVLLPLLSKYNRIIGTQLLIGNEHPQYYKFSNTSEQCDLSMDENPLVSK